MTEFIKENISWIKDILTLIFAGILTIIGILTYKRARATILQPIRTEVIKKQSELLSRLLEFLRGKNQHIESEIDYINLVQLNIFMNLKEYGYIFKDQRQLFQKFENEIIGWIPCGKSPILEDVEIIGTFDVNEKEADNFNIGKRKYEKLKNGEIEIEKIYQTKSHEIFITQLTDIAHNPFMPLSIRKTLDEFMLSIHFNLTFILKIELESFILKFSNEFLKSGVAPKFNPLGVYNEFNHKRKHHHKSLANLKEEIRKYLMIDESW